VPAHRPLAALAALATAIVLAGCAAGSPIQARSTDTETLETSIPADATAVRVRVEMFNGAIQVRAGTPGSVSATVTTTGVGATSGEADADREKILVTLDANPDGTVLLRAVYQPDPNSPNQRSAHAVVSVPPDADLDLRTSNGAVTVADVAGAIDVRTSNGEVTLADAVEGATVRTSNGAVELAGSGLLDVETSNSRLTIYGTDASVRAVTSNGDLTFEGTLSEGIHDMKTSNGPITVRLPAGSSFELDASTSNAKVTLDGFEIRTTGAVSEDTLQGTVGEGGPSVTLRTGNGAIVVSAQ
jgi:hypothetical protein